MLSPKFNELLQTLEEFFPKEKSYQKMIEPILINKDGSGIFNKVELLNRLAYTIIDQQRDVESIIIPIWVNMMLMGMSPDFFRESPNASIFVQSFLRAYGHQQYNTKEDLKKANKKGSSRTDAFLNVYQNKKPDEFFQLIEENRDNIQQIYLELEKYPFISTKSATFFLRDIEGFEFDILPIDVNVGLATQYTGMTFARLPSLEIDYAFSDIKNKIIRIDKRQKLTNYLQISDAIFAISQKLDRNPYRINRYLFLLGADYCQILNCKKCPVKQICYYHSTLDDKEKVLFNALIKKNQKKSTKNKKIKTDLSNSEDILEDDTADDNKD